MQTHSSCEPEDARLADLTTDRSDSTDPQGYDLAVLGWDERCAGDFEPFAQRGLSPARVALGQRGTYRLYGGSGELEVRVAGEFRRAAAGPGAFPVVGDWVAVEARPGERGAIIRAVLPRRSAFRRKAAGELGEQVLAANVDTVLLVSGLDGDFNPRRIERYLVAAWESGARPVVVLSKADLCSDVEERVRRVEEVAPGVAIHPISSVSGEGMASLDVYVRSGQTVALLGSSGAGKSTLLNRLAGGEWQRTGEVRARDSRGRHTTTRRELIVLPGGGLVIDTPGLREIQPWESKAGERAAFEDVERLAAECRFGDCSHEGEPGCAVRAAVAEGVLAAGRLESYLRMRRERLQLEVRLDKRARSEQERRMQAIHKEMRHYRPRG